MLTVLSWIGLVISDTAAQLLLKKGTMVSGDNWDNYFFILAGYSLYFLSFLLWMQILKQTPLHVALCGASVIFITIALGSYFFLGEPLTVKSVVGTVLVAIGVYLVGYSKKPDSEINSQ